MKFSKKKIDEYKIFAAACGPIRIVLDYNYNNKRYWAIESYEGSIIVYNITDNQIHDKCRNNFTYQITDSAVVYRFPFAPYRYGVATDSLPYSYDWNHNFYIVDFVKNKKRKLLDCVYRYLHIYEYGNNQYAIYAYKKHSPVAFLKYDEEQKLIESCTYYNTLTNPHNKNQKFKIGDLTVLNELFIKNSSYFDPIEEKVRPLQAVNSVVPDNIYMSETISGSYTLSHIKSKAADEVILVKEFVDFLSSSRSCNEYVLADYYIHRLKHLCDACDELDSKRLDCFIDCILSRMRSKKYLLEGSHAEIKFFVHNVSFDGIQSHMVEEHYSHWENGSFKKGIIPVDFYHNCSFDISIRIEISYDPKIRERGIDQDLSNLSTDDFKRGFDEGKDNSNDSIFDLGNDAVEEISLDTLFEDDYESDEDESIEPEVKTPGEKFYKFVFPK